MLQNSNAATAAAQQAAQPSTTNTIQPTTTATAAMAAAAAAAAAAANNAAIAASSIQPKLVVIRRRPNQGFGFTLRHFIAYPPEDDAASWPQEATNVGGGGGGGGSGGGGNGSVVGLEPTSLPPYQVKAMETIFIKEVQANGPAHYANLQTGDRVLMVNNTPIAGIAYSTIVSMIKQTPAVLTLHVVPKECDVLQMHYTSIAHTPESNRLTMSAQATPPPQSSQSHSQSVAAVAVSPAMLANGAATIKSTFPQQQQLISYPAVANSSSSPASSVSPATPQHAPPLHSGSRSGSITSNASGSGIPSTNSYHHHQQQQQLQLQQQQQQQQHPHVASRNQAITGSGGSIDFSDMAYGLRQQHQQHQQQLYHQHQQLLSSSFMRANQPPNLTVLASTTATTPTTRQPKSAAALSQALYAVNASGGGGAGGGENSDLMIRLRESIKQKEEFLKSPLPSGVLSASGSVSSSNGNASQSSPQQQQQQLAQHFFPSHTPPGTVGGGVQRVRHQVLLKQQQHQQQHQQQQQQVVLGCDMYSSSYVGSKLVARPLSAASHPSQQRQVAVNVANNNAAKYAKELDYFETLQETGVTNKVFESKLVSHMSKGFDPFKPLSINTNAASESSSSLGAAAAKKQSVLYESLQQHPLHQMQAKYQQSSSSSAVDGQTSSRMELHKATLANATIDSTPSKYSEVHAEHSAATVSSSSHTVATLADIAESSAAAIVDTTIGANSVVRRYKPLASSSFDEGKPMRRISYLRATNNETEFHAADPSADGVPASAAAAAVVAVAAAAAAAAAVVEPHKTKALVEEHPDPTYDVIGGTGGGHEFIETPNGLEDVRLSTHIGSRRASMNSDMRSSIHIDAELNGKYVPNELEAFETEIEIKSSCINGKRMSEYRSWRQVKLVIEGDLLRIYSGRHAKSEHNVIELDIRNFKFYDESLDKKKFLIRMQSKPSASGAHLATLGNELNLDDAHDKLTSSGSSSAAEPQTPATTTAPSCGPYTEILFKTKSSNEMKRLFGLLQWKDSLNYDDNEQQLAGKQLAEPQKTAATSSYLDDVAGAADSSPLSSHSGGGLVEGPAAASIAAAATTGDSISPVMKLRKPSSHKNVPDKDLGSPKSKNWKDLLFRRGGSGGGVSHGDLASSGSGLGNKTGGSIGLPLRACPMSKNNAYVPHLVDVCTNIVETKGLSVVGIYRIPGNKAAISELSELVNMKDFQFESCATDDRWEDVNVVSSLLKLFIRSLPDALMPASFYINFIEADKKTGLERIVLLKDIVESLPRHPYETMKHLIKHLCRVSDNCEVNRMEPKNLAIIFGPSIIRTPNDTLETAVKDMKHQCRIVELLVTQYEYFFEGGSLPDVADLSGGAAAPSPAQPQQTQEDQTSMLLHNLSKIERITERETRTSRFIPQLRRRTHAKRSAVNSDTYSGDSLLSLDYAKVSASSTSSSSTLHSSKTNNTTTKLISSAISSSSSTSTSTSTSATTTKTSSATSTKKRSTGGFLSGSRNAQTRKASLDEKDSGSVGSAGSTKHEQQHQQRSSVDISILLTDDDSSSRLSDTGSMSLTTITDTLDSKLRNLRSGSESNDENGSPEFPKNRRHTLGQPLHLHSENIPYADESPERLFHTFCALDAPHSLLLSRSCTATNSLGDSKEDKQQHQLQQLMMKPVVAPLPANLLKAAHKLQHSATAPIHQGCSTAPASGAATPTAGTGSSSASTPLASTPSSQSANTAVQRNSYSSKNLRFSNSLAYERGGIGCGAGAGSDDDSEGSTTSDPKEKLLMATPSFFLERYNKKRRDHRLFRSASFNCRNYSTRHMSSSSNSTTATAAAAAAACCSPTSSSSSSWAHAAAALTKDEKTDMNLTKKRQIQNKQNRSIKRRHTVGGPHDYAANSGANGAGGVGAGGGGGVGGGHDLAAINYNHHNRHHQQQLLKLGGSAGGAEETTTTTTTTTTVLRRLGAPSVSGVSGVNNDGANVALPVSGSSSSSNSSSNATNNNNNNSPLSDGSNANNATSNVGGGGGGDNSSSNSSSSSTGVSAGDQVLEVGIRIKNINRGRY